MQSQNGDVELSVRLSTKDIESDAQKIKREIEKTVQSTKITPGVDVDSVTKDTQKVVETTTEVGKRSLQEIQKEWAELSSRAFNSMSVEESVQINNRLFQLADEVKQLSQAEQDTFNKWKEDLMSVGRIMDSTSESTSNMEQNVSEAKTDIQDTVNQTSQFTSEFEQLKQQSAEFVKALQQAQEQAQKLATTLKSLNENKKYGKDDSTEFELQKLQGQYGILVSKMALLQERLQLTRQEAVKGTKAVQQTGKSATQAMTKAAKSTQKLNKEMKETNNHGRKLKVSFLSLLGAAVGIRSLYALFGKLRSAITDGIKSLAQLNNGNNKVNESISMLMNSLNQLKNSFGAAFAPILTAVAPALNYLINLLTQAINAIAQLIAYISGSNTWIKAKKQSDDYAKSLNKTGNAAKKAAGRLAAFDDLNVLGKDDEAGGAGGVDPGKLFEEAPIESWVEELFAKLKELWEKLKPILEHVWDVFKQGFWDAAKDIKDRIANIIENLLKIKDHLIDIFTDPAVVNAMKGWFDSLIYLIGSIVGAMALIGVSIAQNLVGGIEKYLAENTGLIKKYLVDMFDVWDEINIQIAQFIQAMANIFSVIGDENGQEVTSNIIGIFAGAFQAVTLLLSRFARDLIKLLTQPIIDNQTKIRSALNGILGAFAILTQGIEDFVNRIGSALQIMYSKNIEPLMNNLTTGISELVDKLLDVWARYVQPILIEAGKYIDTLLNDYIMPVIQNFIDMLGDLADIINAIWTKYLQPIISWLISNVLPSLIMFGEQIMQIIEFVSKVLFTNLGLVTDLMRTAYDFVRDVFTIGIIGAFINLKDNILEIIDSWITNMIDAWQHLKQNIDTLDRRIKEEIEHIYQQIGEWLHNKIESIKNDAIQFWTELKDGVVEKALKLKTDLITHWTVLKTKTIEKFHAIRDGIIKVFEAIKSGIKTPLNGIISIVEGMVNAVIDGINFLINKINAFTSISSKLPSNLAFNIEPIANLEHVQIPRLASGAVIPPNKEFLALLGDQTSGTNIEAPLDTIKDAFADVLSTMQMQQSPNYAEMELDGETFARLIVPYVVSELNRQGYDVSVIGA